MSEIWLVSDDGLKNLNRSSFQNYQANWQINIQSMEASKLYRAVTPDWDTAIQVEQAGMF